MGLWTEPGSAALNVTADIATHGLVEELLRSFLEGKDCRPGFPGPGMYEMRQGVSERFAVSSDPVLCRRKPSAGEAV